MAHDPAKSSPRGLGAVAAVVAELPGPWKLMLPSVLISLTGAGLVLAEVDPWAILLTVAGLILAAGAVAWRLRLLGDDLADQLDGAAVVAILAVLAWVACGVTAPRWDSVGLLFGVIGGLSCLGVLLVLLPPIGRKIVVSLLVLFHFG